MIEQESIPITKPSITQLEINQVCDAITNGWGSKCYEYIHKFQDVYADFIGTNHALATSSCTGALHLTLMGLGIGEGDEVIMPDVTWIASVSPIMYVGATPVFVDIDLDTWCINPDLIRNKITARTKAILVVHLYGSVVDMDPILEIAKEYGLKVIEDAAEAIGSEYKGKKVGGIGDAGVFSFHGTKTMTTGEGGMVVTNDDKLIKKISILNDHGREPEEKRVFWVNQYGYKYKMSNLDAALGFAQMKRINDLIDKKREIFSWYKEEFSDLPILQMNKETIGTKNSYWMPTIIFSSKKKPFSREDLTNYLGERKIHCRPFFYPLSSLPFFNNVLENEVSYSLAPNGVNLPSYHDLRREQVSRIAESIKNFIQKK